MVDIDKFLGWSYNDIKTFSNITVLAETYRKMDEFDPIPPVPSRDYYWDFALNAALDMGFHFVKLCTQERLTQMRAAYIEMTDTT